MFNIGCGVGKVLNTAWSWVVSWILCALSGVNTMIRGFPGTQPNATWQPIIALSWVTLTSHIKLIWIKKNKNKNKNKKKKQNKEN